MSQCSARQRLGRPAASGSGSFLTRPSDGLDVDEVAVLRPLPQQLHALQLAAVQSEARPRRQLQQSAGDGHEHQHVEAAQAQGRRPRAGVPVRHGDHRVLGRLPVEDVVTWEATAESRASAHIFNSVTKRHRVKGHEKTAMNELCRFFLPPADSKSSLS